MVPVHTIEQIPALYIIKRPSDTLCPQDSEYMSVSAREDDVLPQMRFRLEGHIQVPHAVEGLKHRRPELLSYYVFSHARLPRTLSK